MIIPQPPSIGDKVTPDHIKALIECIRELQLVETPSIGFSRSSSGTAPYYKGSPAAIPDTVLHSFKVTMDGTDTVTVEAGYCRYGADDWSELSATGLSLAVGGQVYVTLDYQTGEWELLSGTAPVPSWEQGVWVIAVRTSLRIKQRWNSDIVQTLDLRGSELMVFQRKQDESGEPVYGMDWTRAHD